ncbi:hypothetical protein PEBR_32229 [Penicillium brasilianum]|uniref:Xylanolytic transcriptional activator regulatory domain-containing protein n=1 Tax=Penicillium brasilianum TaxID=104259 RepID=A0A1S9RES8_PENBI|nr:hypothetical protein PEBR_32229 [Penicillium brasilianum]
MCQFTGPQGLTRKQSQGIQDHLCEIQSRIEQLSAINVQPQRLGLGQSSTHFVPNTLQPQPRSSAERDRSELQKDFTGNMVVDQHGTQYVDPTHWQAVLNEISEVKEYLQLTEDSYSEENPDDLFAISGPELLLSNTISTPKSDLIAALPTRPVADRLISLYLNSKESTLVLIHIPTFTKEYTQFWRNPEDVSINWLAYLFSILSAGAGLQLFSTSGRADGEIAEAFAGYHRLASECLKMSNYTSPGRYTMETLILSVAMEILRSTDNHLGPSVLLSLTTRLAVHAGYHRDSKRYPEISVFDGEMRRRVWTILSLLDHYISLQAGLPPTTVQTQSDTEEPLNLTDEDLDPAATALPPARPLTEKTAILFPVALNRVMFADAEIIRKVCSIKGVHYQEVLRLDGKLKELHASMPPPLKFRPLSESIADSPNTIMDRYNIDLMYQKARCDLHRRYLAQHRLDPAYAYSRRDCLDAASTILQHQSDIFDASTSGGQLGYTSFFFSPIVAVHFRSAAMIISLEISCQSRYDLKQNLSPDQRKVILGERVQLSQEIERAYNIWNHLRRQSKEATKTADALHIMLKITNNHLQHGATPEQVQPLSPPTDLPATSDAPGYANSLLSTPVMLDYRLPSSVLDNEPSPLDVDLMDATFYLGQDSIPSTSFTQFAGSNGVVDFYEKYWDNLMLLGGDQSFSEAPPPGGSDQGL